MSVAAEPGRLDFGDCVGCTKTHPEGAFELLDRALFIVTPQGDAHLRTQSAISFPAPGWFTGPKPDTFVSRGARIVDRVICARPQAASKTRLAIPEDGLSDLESGSVVVHRSPRSGVAARNESIVLQYAAQQ